MFRLRRNKKGQAIAAEFVLALMIVIGMVSAMTVYIKRGVQARIRDARNYMGVTVAERSGLPAANIWIEYEPYYVETDSNIDYSTLKLEELGGATATDATGVYTKTIDENRYTVTNSITHPPADAD